jgi:FixJ family two-component response regulator
MNTHGINGGFAMNRSLSVAIVDDEESVRVSLRRLCTVLGIDATVYASAREFILALESGETPDCLLLDAHMPQMTGLDLQQHLLRVGTRVPTVVYTADDTPEAQARYIAAGAAGYLRKPVGGEELLAEIERAIVVSRIRQR